MEHSTSSSNPKSMVDLVRAIDSWPYFQEDPAHYKETTKDFYYFMIAGFAQPVGYVHSTFIDSVGSQLPACWELGYKNKLLTLRGGKSRTERNELMEQTLKTIRNECEKNGSQLLPEPWNETFPILYGPANERIMDIDRSGLERFGIQGQGVHLTAFSNDGEVTRYWVARRAGTKRIFPGKFDNVAGGALSSGEQPLDGIVREVAEETGISEIYTRKHVRQCDVLTYAATSGTDIQQQKLYVFEMELKSGVEPKVTDNEVEGFDLMTSDEIRSELLRGAFVPWAAMTWIAFLVRHGYLDSENEPGLGEICRRLHRDLTLFVV